MRHLKSAKADKKLFFKGFDEDKLKQNFFRTHIMLGGVAYFRVALWTPWNGKRES